MFLILLFTFFTSIQSQFCSAYCGTGCTDVTSGGCTDCPSQFVSAVPVCSIDTTIYSIVLESATAGVTSFSNTNTYVCGTYSISGIFAATDTITVYSGTLIPHYQLRVRAFVMWIDNGGLSATDTITVTLSNGSVLVSTAYADNSSLASNQCDTGNQVGYGVDSNDVNHVAATQTINMQFVCSSSCTGTEAWGFKEIIIVVKACHNFCATCTGSLVSQCQSCAVYGGITYYLSSSTCVNPCPDGSFIDGSVCTACSNNCSICTSLTNCSNCNLNYYYQSDNNSCPSTCPAAYYNDTANCYACASNCSVCISASNCSSCQGGYLYLPDNNTCPNACPSAYYNDTGTCYSCLSNCTVCISSGNCSACSSSYVYLPLNNTCPSLCPSGYYNDTGICYVCNSTCATCSSSTICLSCISNYNLYNSTCITSCPSGYFNDTGICYVCNSTCATCSSSLICLSCITSYYLYNSTCVASCPSGYYNDTGICYVCISNCTACTTSGNCSACSSSYIFLPLNNTCPSLCPSGYYNDTGICYTCISNCTVCTSLGNCSSCSSSFVYLPLNNTCPPLCPSNYYNDTSICYICNSTCATCTSDTICLSCITNYYLYNSTCISICPSTYFINITQCSPCDSSCVNCIITSTRCTSCAVGSVLISVNNTCSVGSCPNAFYYIASLNSCFACHSYCALCTSKPSPCSQCNSGYFLYSNSCNTTCPIGYFQNSTINNCDTCPVGCSSCTAAVCNSCVNSSYFLVNSSCITSCPSGYVADPTHSACINCSVSVCQKIILNMTIANSIIYCNVSFNYAMNFSVFPYKNFQTFSFNDPFVNISMFNVSYNTSTNSYLITLTPIVSALLYNQTITVAIIKKNASYYSSNGTIFADDIFGTSISTNWNYSHFGNVSSGQYSIMSSMSALSDTFLSLSSSNFITQLKKYGFVLILLNSLQISSCLLLINTVLPQNLYEMLRILAMMIFYDVPEYQQQSSKNTTVFAVPTSTLVTSRRLTLSQFTFRRTGFSGYFLFDAYSQILLVILIDILAGIVIYLASRYSKLHNIRPYVYTLLHRIHEVCLMYFSLTVVFQFSDLSSNSYRIGSLTVCLLACIYLIGYHAYRYYDLMHYERVMFDNGTQYQKYIELYGNLLRNIRFQENNKKPLINWCAPHYYHCLSYIKKVLMMFALGIFYDSATYQLAALICLQMLEIIRFWCTWPFNSTSRNRIRLAQQLCLLLLLVTILCTDIVYGYLSKIPSNFDQLSVYFFALGWVGISLVVIFNVSFFSLYFLDFCEFCTKGYKQSIESERNTYLLNNYSIKTDNSTKVLKLVQLGFIPALQFEDLPDVEFCIEKCTLKKEADTFELQIYKICNLYMSAAPIPNSDRNSVLIGKTINRLIILRYGRSSAIHMFEKIWKSINDQNLDCISINTFSNIQQKKYKANQKVSLYSNQMSTQICSMNPDKQCTEVIYEGPLLSGFPLSENFIKKLTEEDVLQF